MDVNTIDDEDDDTSVQDDDETTPGESAHENNTDSDDDDTKSNDEIHDEAPPTIEHIDDSSQDSESMVTAVSTMEDNIEIADAEETQNEPEIVVETDNAEGNIATASDKQIHLDVTSSNILPEGQTRQRRPPNINPKEGYNLHNSDENDEYSNVIATYMDA